MNSIQKYSGILAGIAIVIAICAFLVPRKALAPIPSLSATAVTPTNYTNLTLSNQLVVGGSDVRNDGLATSTVTLGLTDLLGNSSIIETNSATTTAFTLDMPSTTTLASYLPHQGDYASYVLYNASSTGPAITIANSADNTFVIKTSQGTSTPAVLYGGYMATLDVFRIGANAGQGGSKLIGLFSESNQ